MIATKRNRWYKSAAFCSLLVSALLPLRTAAANPPPDPKPHVEQVIVNGVPDIDQRWKALPLDGRNYCAPASAMNSIHFFRQHGFPGLVPSSSTIVDNITEMAEYMDTDEDWGTWSGNDEGYEEWLSRYDEDGRFTFTEVSKWDPWDDLFNINDILEWLKLGVPVNLNYGHYTWETSFWFGDRWVRDSGHFVTVTGVEVEQRFHWALDHAVHYGPKGKRLPDEYYDFDDPWDPVEPTYHLDAQNFFKIILHDPNTDENNLDAQSTTPANEVFSVGQTTGPFDVPGPFDFTGTLPSHMKNGKNEVYEGILAMRPKSVVTKKSMPGGEPMSRVVNRFIGAASDAPAVSISRKVGDGEPISTSRSFQDPIDIRTADDIIDIAYDPIRPRAVYVTAAGDVDEVLLARDKTRPLLQGINARRALYGGERQRLYVYAVSGSGPQIIALDRYLEKAGNVDVQPLGALAFDDALGQLVTISPDGSELAFYDEDLQLRNRVALPSDLSAGYPEDRMPRQTVSIHPRTGEIFIQREGSITLRRISLDKEGNATVSSVNLESAIAPAGLHVLEDGSFLVSQSGQLQHFSPEGHRKTSMWTGIEAENVFAVSRNLKLRNPSGSSFNYTYGR